jgi:hypothetical protein
MNDQKIIIMVGCPTAPTTLRASIAQLVEQRAFNP